MSTMLSIFPKDENPTLLAIDDEQQVVYVDGEPCELTHQEFSLLQELAQNIDRPVSRQELLRDAWGYVCPGETRTVDGSGSVLSKNESNQTASFACFRGEGRRFLIFPRLFPRMTLDFKG